MTNEKYERAKKLLNRIEHLKEILVRFEDCNFEQAEHLPSGFAITNINGQANFLAISDVKLIIKALSDELNNLKLEFGKL